jgi:hypothetical protein
MGGVTLLARGVAIGFQHRVDEGHQWRHYGSLPFPLLALRWCSIGQRLTYHPAMHSQFARDAEHGTVAEFVFPTYLLE